jgi:hypothetical protein
MAAGFTQTSNFVIPDLIGNPWPKLSSMPNGQAMDSRVRGNDKVCGCDGGFGGVA